MGWNKNDFIAAGLILTIVIVGILVALFMLGVFNPTNINTVFPFQ